MCRIFAYWGEEARNLRDLLIDAPNSLRQQSISDETHRPNADGWGIAYFLKEGQPRLIKRPEPAFSDQFFEQSISRLCSHLIFAHVRRGSHGHICYENTHPFIFGSWVFMHNGNIPDFPDFREYFYEKCQGGEYFGTIGDTDSEFLFHCFLTRLKNSNAQKPQEVMDVLRVLINRVNEWVPEEKQAQLALNFIITNGSYLIGYRQNRSLFFTHLDTGSIIASEKLTPEYVWEEIPERHFVYLNSPREIRVLSFHSNHVEI